MGQWAAMALRCAWVLLWPSSVVGQLLLGLSLTKSGPSHEVLKAQLIEQSLELVVSRANENAFTPNGFQDHRGNPMQFGLRVFDDQGNATKVQELYRAMIQDRLVDLLLGPQTQALSEAARSVTTALQRTLMLWSLHTMSVDNFPLQAGQPGTFSVAVPVENLMDQGLRILKSLGSTEVRAIVGTDRISEFMCTKAMERAEALGYASERIVARPQNNYELLTEMQQRFTQPLDVLFTCTSEAEMLNVVMVASRLNVSAQAMLSYNADSLATYNTVGPAVTALLAPTDWHHEVSYPCRAFIDTQTYVQIFQFRYNQLPSTQAAVATAAAITLMATLQQTVFEGPDLDKNIRLAAQLQSTVVNTIVGPVRFKVDGSSDRMAVTVQVAEVEGVGFQGQLLNETNLSNLEWPMPSWDSKFQRELECPKGTIYNAYVAGNGTESCLLCPAGFTNAPKGEWCQACSVGTFAPSEGSECLPCAPGANCIASGTTMPGSLPEYYRFDASPDGTLYFLKCLDGLCLGDNQCLGSNNGALCLSCLPGTTNMGVLRRRFQCSNCLPTAVLVIFLIIYFLIIYFFVVITAEASVHGMIWKRVISYWQICSAATHVGRLYRTDGFLQLLSDLILYPFHTLLGFDCLFFGAARNSQTFVFLTGAALMPAIFAASTVFFIIKTGIQVINSQNARSKRGRKNTLPIKELFIKTIQGATRWNVASLYVLYCPTLIIFVSCCSFVQFDVLRMRYWLDVPMREVTFFAVFSGTVCVLQGLAIPSCLLLILRRLKNRNSLKDANSQYVFGMLYNDMKPEYWFYEITFFFKRFMFMTATAIPDEVLRILVFAWVAFLHLQSLVLMKPFSTLEGNILQKLETCFIFSVYVILSSQIALIWFDNAASEVVALTLVYLTHAVFSVMVIRSLLTSLIYQPLTLKALAMPQAMNPLERLICHADSITRVSWDSSRQRLHFYNLTRRSRLKLLNTLNEVLHMYIARGDEFHASYLSVAIEQAVSHCMKQRREALVADHPRMLAQERRRGISGCLAYWFPSLLLGSRAAEGIALAKQQRIDRRSLNSALPLVSSHEATMNELHSAFFDYAFHHILLADVEFFQVKETPVALRHWPPKGTKDKKRTIRSNLLMHKAPSVVDSETWREEKKAEVTVEVKPKLSEEQLNAELPQLLAEAEQLQAERDDLLNRLEEKEADIEWLLEMLDGEEEIPCDDGANVSADPATMPGEVVSRC